MMQLSFFKTEETKFKDAKFMTSNEKKKAYDSFKKVIDTRDIKQMTKLLYTHLNCHCGFIAHYNIHGFKDTYSGEGFRDFIEHFAKYFRIEMRLEDFSDINTEMYNYVMRQYPDIIKELDYKQRQRACLLVKNLVNQYNINLENL